MNWPEVELQQIIKLKYGSALPERDRDVKGAIPVMGSNGRVGCHNTATVLGPGIVVGRKGSAGKVTWIDTSFFPIDTTFYVVTKRSVEMRWAFYLLSFLNLERLSIVTGVPGLSRSDAYNLKCFLPPPSEQRRIIEILDQADALRRRRAEADAKAARILPALFTKMFGDPATNPRGLTRERMEKVILDTQYGTSTKSSDSGDGIPVLRMNNIGKSGYLDLTDMKHVVLSDKDQEKYMLNEGDLLFNRTNSRELVGKTGLWYGELDAVAASYLIRVRVDRDQALPAYVWAWMNTPYMKQCLFDMARHAIGQANINAEELRSLPIVIPSLDEQLTFTSKITNLQQTQFQDTVVKQDLQGLFEHLLRRAFSGDLTARWREAHMQELLSEMEQQARWLGLGGAPSSHDGLEQLASDSYQQERLPC